MPAVEWLLLLATLPTEDPAVRMRVLRTLEALGAAPLREGAYLLPDSAAGRQALEALAEHIAKTRSSAHVLQVGAVTKAQQEAFRGLFDRTARYERLIKVIESLRIGYGVSDPGAIARVLRKQRDEFEMISLLDFFPNDTRARAEKALVEAEAAVRRLMFPAHTGAVREPTGERLLARIWATRKPLWADRLACAWLIRRFVDPEATMVWLDKAQSPPAKAIGFGFSGAHYSNSSTQVTFEEMLARLDLARNSGLARIGSIVRFLEIGGSPVPEAAGVQTLLQGAVRRCANEDEILHESEKTFDLLFEAYEEQGRL